MSAVGENKILYIKFHMTHNALMSTPQNFTTKSNDWTLDFSPRYATAAENVIGRIAYFDAN